MNKLLKFFTALFAMIMIAYTSGAQAADTMANKPVQMADAMRSNGKIYVVVAVLAIIFLGIIFYLVRLEKKISHLEKNSSAS
jgi:CcmD family protein